MAILWLIFMKQREQPERTKEHPLSPVFPVSKAAMVSAVFLFLLYEHRNPFRFLRGPSTIYLRSIDVLLLLPPSQRHHQQQQRQQRQKVGVASFSAQSESSLSLCCFRFVVKHLLLFVLAGNRSTRLMTATTWRGRTQALAKTAAGSRRAIATAIAMLDAGPWAWSGLT